MESTSLGMAKVYFSAKDFGKMLKLKDVGNLVVTDISVDKITSDVEVTVITPMDNVNGRVRSIDTQSNKRYKADLELDEKAYLEVDRDRVCIYFKGEKVLVKCDNTNAMVNIIKSKLKSDKEIPIYIDIVGVGLSVYDSLKAEGYNVFKTENDILKIN